MILKYVNVVKKQHYLFKFEKSRKYFKIPLNLYNSFNRHTMYYKPSIKTRGTNGFCNKFPFSCLY